MARRKELDLRLRIRVGEDIALGPGKADLLEAIAATGSISSAARTLGMSYRRAWLLVETMNRCFKTPLVQAKTGGKSGGGAEITASGREALRHYRAMQKAADKACGSASARLSRLMR
ncbi:MAG: LysR family transcriptional regulator [Alphaproteobacteria bacterium]|jgi:molybdate transport system regulatory protein|nr:LysR family transcriptional regulator [Alphaproteobacteria bacterium]